MKFENILVAIVVSLLVVTITANSGAAVTCGKYTVDGSIADWGVDLSQDWSQNSTWLPNAGITFIAEDNRDPVHGELPFGVHIRGIGSWYVPYEEPQILHRDGYYVTEPYGGEKYDMEAMYVDQDASCIYVAIVTSELPTGEGDLMPGDLALNTDNDLSTGEYGYEYGVKLGQNYLTQFDIYSMPDWEASFYFPLVRPTIFKSGSSKVGSATGAYVDSGINDNGLTNYVIEVAIPKSDVGDPEDVGMNNLHIADQCGNDYIPAPEFVFAAIPVAIIGIVLVFAHRSAKKKVDLLQ
jgi:hypothetical protein